MIQPLQDALQNALSTIVGYIPQLIAAIVILVVGYLVAKLLQVVVRRVLQSIGFDQWMERGGIKQFFDRAQTEHTPATIIGLLVFWFIFIIAITMATDALGIPQVSAVLREVVAYIPNVIAAILVVILAALLANFVAGIIRGATGVEILATGARVAIIVYAVFVALTQLGIAVELTAPTFLIVLAGVVVAAAIAFGWGGREIARDILERAYGLRRRDQEEAAGEVSAQESEESSREEIRSTVRDSVRRSRGEQ